jgi:transcriptional regulator with XRE-family HTH domain
MGFTPLERKTALAAKKITQADIAAACQVHPSLVSHVIAGRRWMGSEGRKVLNYIADQLGLPVEEVFPGSDRRKGYRAVEAAIEALAARTAA